MGANVRRDGVTLQAGTVGITRLARLPTVTLNLNPGDERFACGDVAARLLSTLSWLEALS